VISGVAKSITIVSFNKNEADAVEDLLSDIASGPPSPWARDGATGISRHFGPDEWRLEHVAVRAQGNVIAAAQLAEIFSDRDKKPDYVVFYGCAGALRGQDAKSAFLIQYANYVSLGTVGIDRGVEKVTLKNKWLCALEPTGDVDPLPPVSFPMAIPGRSPLDLSALTGIPGARVIATDKVVRIRPSAPPVPVVPPPPSARYQKGEWTYGQALSLWVGPDGPVVVEMESYGIGRIGQALKLDDRVVVLRVTTDSLADHADSDVDQRALLHAARALLGHVLAALFNPTYFQP